MDTRAAHGFDEAQLEGTQVFEDEYGNHYRLVADNGRVRAISVAADTTPGPMQQLIAPNPEIACTPGLCLVYVRETFGIGPKYPTAMEGWMASPYKHPNQNFPEGMWVPVWFSLADEPAGHVALRQPDGSIWSSSHPTETTPVHHSSLDDVLSYYGGRLTYLGWTEDIEGVQVVNSAEA